jgi:hypothetical protein
MIGGTDVPLHASAMPDASRQFLRHTVATLAYRAEKVLRDPPERFADLRLSPTSRTALEVLSHMGDLLEWGERMLRGEHRWAPVAPTTWTAASDRFFADLAALDAALAEPLSSSLAAEVVFQGPIADALTHVGQLAMMRGVAQAPVRPESYARAGIEVGRVGRDQSTTRKEFDGDASRR